jgi:hypothetical protein
MISEGLVVIVAVSGVFIWLILSTIMSKLTEIYKFSRLTRLKERMLEAGMTAVEIEKVAAAGLPIDAENDSETVQIAKHAKGNAVNHPKYQSN